MLDIVNKVKEVGRPEAARWIASICSKTLKLEKDSAPIEAALRKSVLAVVDIYSSLLKSKNKDGGMEKLDLYLASKFNLPKKRTGSTPHSSSVKPRDTAGMSPVYQNVAVELACELTSQRSHLTNLLKEKDESMLTTLEENTLLKDELRKAKKRRGDLCDAKAEIKTLKSVLATTEDQMSAAKKKLTDKMMEVKRLTQREKYYREKEYTLNTSCSVDLHSEYTLMSLRNSRLQKKNSSKATSKLKNWRPQ